MRLQDVILRGLAAARPAAATTPIGVLYYSTDTIVLERNNGTTWDSYSAAAGITQLTGDVTAGPGSGSQAATIPANSISDAKLRQGAATSVIGRSANSLGNVADIAAAADDRILRRTGGTLNFGQLTVGMFPANLVTFTEFQQITSGRVLGRGTAAAGNVEQLTPASGIETTATPGIRLTQAARTFTRGITIDGGGSVITTGVKGYLSIPIDCTIVGVRLLADQSGSIVIDLWVDIFANYPPTVADTITASAKPTLSSQDHSEDTTLTGWTTTFAAGSVMGFNVDSVATVKRVTLELQLVKN